MRALFFSLVVFQVGCTSTKVSNKILTAQTTREVSSLREYPRGNCEKYSNEVFSVVTESRNKKAINYSDLLCRWYGSSFDKLIKSLDGLSLANPIQGVLIRDNSNVNLYTSNYIVFSRKKEGKELQVRAKENTFIHEHGHHIFDFLFNNHQFENIEINKFISKDSLSKDAGSLYLKCFSNNIKDVKSTCSGLHDNWINLENDSDGTVYRRFLKYTELFSDFYVSSFRKGADAMDFRGEERIFSRKVIDIYNGESNHTALNESRSVIWSSCFTASHNKDIQKLAKLLFTIFEKEINEELSLKDVNKYLIVNAPLVCK